MNRVAQRYVRTEKNAWRRLKLWNALKVKPLARKAAADLWNRTEPRTQEQNVEPSESPVDA